MVLARTASVALAFLVVACSGPTGPQGETGEAGPSGLPGERELQGEAGTATQVPPGPMAMNTDAGVSIPVSCLSPCHGFNGVVSQFQTSVHYTEYLVNAASATPETAWTAPGSPCGNCHAIDALQQRVSGNVLTSNDGGVANLASGELQYRDPLTHALSSANYAGTANNFVGGYDLNYGDPLGRFAYLTVQYSMR